MNSIPIFDSLTHPMPNGNWLIPRYDGQNTIERLNNEMKANNVGWGLAVGMGRNIGGYSEEGYASFVLDNSNSLFPVAFFDFRILNSGVTVKDYLNRLKAIGYVGIKIHPRLSSVNAQNPFLKEIITISNSIGLAILFCTYFWSKDKNLCAYGPEQLMIMLSDVPTEKIILIHGGAVRLLEVAEIARQFENVLLDLSLTLCKWEGSSLDHDIRFLFNKFDRRICIGSDGPEFGQSDLRRRFEYFAQGVSVDKLENIAFKNLGAHLDIIVS